MITPAFGRRPPTDWNHVEKYRLTAVQPMVPVVVEDLLPLAYSLRTYYDQGREGACVGFGWSWAMSILNRIKFAYPKYDASWLYHQAQLVDEWTETPPEEGTSVRAGGDVLRTRGHMRHIRGHNLPVDPNEGILSNRWAVSVDEVRACISLGIPVVIGVNWYEKMMEPEKVDKQWWIGRGDLGRIAGGHCVCIYGASDRRDAFKVVNNWGKDWPLVWLPYETMARLIVEDGEVAVITDR